jgi:hypothetical protein
MSPRYRVIKAPYLIGRTPRVRLYSGLPDEIKEGLRDIARHEHKSMSWVVEEMIIDYFSLRRPKYLKPKGEK